jgi:hypothetical protein
MDFDKTSMGMCMVAKSMQRIGKGGDEIRSTPTVAK